jgi:tryptophanyl-tRNA synthetase
LPDSVEALAARPEALNLVTIYAALTDRTPQSVVQEFAGQGFGTFKPALADLLVETLAPIRARLKDFEADPGAIDAILVAGSQKAAALAAPTLEGAYRALGLPR